MEGLTEGKIARIISYLSKKEVRPILDLKWRINNAAFLGHTALQVKEWQLEIMEREELIDGLRELKEMLKAIRITGRDAEEIQETGLSENFQ